MMIGIELAEVQRLPWGSHGRHWILSICLLLVKLCSLVIRELLLHMSQVCLACLALTALLGHSCEDTNVGAIVVVTSTRVTLTTFMKSKFRWIAHACKHYISELLLA